MTKAKSGTLLELSQEDLAQLVKFGRERSVPKGELVFDEGDEPDTLWLVRSGRVHMFKTASGGEETMVAFYGAGQSFCVAASIIGKPFPCASRAAVDSVVIAIPGTAFSKLYDALPSFARRLLEEMAPQFCDAHCDCAMNVESVEMRLAMTLLRLDRQFQGKAIPFTRQELAQMVNTTVESCIRTLSGWTKSGVIEGTRGELHLKNREALQAVANGA